MKKRVLIGFVLFAMVAASAAFAQSTGRYYLEIYEIDDTVHNTLEKQKNNTSISREDQYISVRTDVWTRLVSKDRSLTLDQLEQKLRRIDSNYPNTVKTILQEAQQKWGVARSFDMCGEQYISFVYYWIRRTE